MQTQTAPSFQKPATGTKDTFQARRIIYVASPLSHPDEEVMNARLKAARAYTCLLYTSPSPRD